MSKVADVLCRPSVLIETTENKNANVKGKATKVQLPLQLLYIRVRMHLENP